MTKIELAERIATAEVISKAKATRIINHLIAAVRDQLHSEEGRIRIAGLGTFRLRNRPERRAYSPSKKTHIVISAGKKVTFKASPSLK